ncbi:MAG: ferrous iron transport protein A [Candidatus Hydrogenedentes bacterium]|nr:ferrous iron transport protein A [Candidatus Hydrogenedentota bacterium]
MTISKPRGTGKEEPTTIRLSELSEGDTGIILSIKGGPIQYRKRLLDLGLIPGTQFKIVREAPLGDPIEIEVKGYSLALRRKDAWHIIVQPTLQKPSGQ